jgi:hypothetical protein
VDEATKLTNTLECSGNENEDVMKEGNLLKWHL